MIKFVVFLFLITITVYTKDLSVDDSCTYIFKAKTWYDADLTMKVVKLEEKNFNLTIKQRNGAVVRKKTLKVPLGFNKENISDIILKLTSDYNKDKIKVVYKNIKDGYKFQYRGKKYKGFLLKLHLMINKKLYKLSYIFSEEFPVLGLFRFTVAQDISSKKKYKFKNVMLLKECRVKGKLIKL